HLRRVDGVVRPVDQRHAEPRDGRADQLDVLHRLLDALVDGRPEALRNHAADDLVDELVPLVVVDRLDLDVAVAELAATAGLLLLAGPRPPPAAARPADA